MQNANCYYANTTVLLERNLQAIENEIGEELEDVSVGWMNWNGRGENWNNQ